MLLNGESNVLGSTQNARYACKNGISLCKGLLAAAARKRFAAATGAALLVLPSKQRA